jgi:hypothetical protein
LKDKGKYDICHMPTNSSPDNDYNNSFVPIWELCTTQKRKTELIDAFHAMNTNVENGLVQNELFVVDWGFSSHKDATTAKNSHPDKSIPVIVDLNRGTGGNFIFLHYTLGAKKDAYTNFCIEIVDIKEKDRRKAGGNLGGSYTAIHDDATNVKFVRNPQELNQNANAPGDKGRYIFMSGTKDSRFKPVRRLHVICDESVSTYPDEWTVVRELGKQVAADCNAGAAKGNNKIFVIQKR